MSRRSKTNFCSLCSDFALQIGCAQIMLRMLGCTLRVNGVRSRGGLGAQGKSLARVGVRWGSFKLVSQPFEREQVAASRLASCGNRGCSCRVLYLFPLPTLFWTANWCQLETRHDHHSNGSSSPAVLPKNRC